MDYKSFLDALHKRINAGKDETSEMISALNKVIAEVALDGDSANLPGFGCFEPRKRLERVAVHPGNGKKMLIPPKITLTFRPSNLLKQKIRDNEQ